MFSVFNSVVFLVQMIRLYQDPDGKDVFSKTAPTEDHLQSDVENLRVKVLELENQLSKVCLIK